MKTTTELKLDEVTAIETPSSGVLSLYAKNTGVFSKNSAGEVNQLSYVNGIKEASNSIRNSYDAEVTAGSADSTYFKVKTFTFTQPLNGSARFLFDLGVSQTSTTAYGRIYRNGTPLGNEQTNTSTYLTKTQDITQNWAVGDTCELWIKCTSPYAVAMGVKNFRIAYDNLTTVTVTYS